MLNKLNTVTYYTFKELFKSNIFYITLFVGISLMLVTYVATEFTYGVPEKIALDFGLGCLSLTSMGISLFMGANLLTKEIDSRTVYMVISRPVPRWIFITGKICGLILVLMINLIVLSAMTLVCSTLLGGKLNSVIFLSIFFNLLECILLLLLVVFFSLFSNTILSSFMSFVILVIGHGVKATLETNFVINRPALGQLLEFYHLVLPGFYKLNLKDFVIYNKELDTAYIAGAMGYGFCYSAFLFVMIIYLFNRKNLD